MKIIEDELEKIKLIIDNTLSDPTDNGDLKHFLLNGSKMIRSTLAILYIKSHGIELDENIYNILAAGEVIHNASLLHDDVLDEQIIRRGEPTFANKFSSKISILLGDYLLSVAVKKLLSVNNNYVLKEFQNCTMKMAESEIKQYFLRGKIPTGEEYIHICEGKTASLFAAILKSCAVVMNFSKENAKDLATKFGICFQIKNDLDVLSAKTDRKNGIYTAIDILGIEKTTALLDNYKEEMINLLGNFADNVYTRGLKDLISTL